MNYLNVKLICTVTILSIFLVNCESQFSDDNSVNDEQLQENVEKAFHDLNARIGSNSAINYKKIYVILKEEAGVSYRDVVLTWKKEEIQKIIKKLETLTNTKRDVNNKEFNASVHGILANEYLRLSIKTGEKNYLDKSIAHIKAAISMLEPREKYRVTIARAYYILINSYSLKQEYEKVFSLLKYSVEEFQDIEIGPFKDFYASKKVKSLHNLIQQADIEKDLKRKIINYIKSVAEKYNNEIGVTAQVELLKHYLSIDRIEEAKVLSGSIKNRLASINNAKFKNQKIKTVNRLMKHTERSTNL